MENLNQIIKQFPEVGEVKEVKALTSGLINQTYLVKTVDPQEADYVLQRINHQIFTDIDMLQHNIEVVTGHIRKKLEAQNETDIDRKVLRFLPATDGKTFYYDGEGYWRVSVFIPRSQTLEAVTPDSSYLAGLKFGEFQAMLADPLKDNLTFPACLFSCRSMSRLGSGASFATHSVFISPSLITGTACVPQRIRASFAKSISCRTTLENLQGVSPRFIGFCSLAYPL